MRSVQQPPTATRRRWIAPVLGALVVVCVSACGAPGARADAPDAQPKIDVAHAHEASAQSDANAAHADSRATAPAIVAAADAPAAQPPAHVPRKAFAYSRAAGPQWIVRPGDNICGLRDARMLSNPARVDLAALLDSTPEMALLSKQRIDPDAALGLQLRQKALDRCMRVCETLRVLGGYCSVWDRVEHRDGRSVPDLTSIALSRVSVGPEL